MKLDESLALRLQFLSRVVKKEANYLQETDARLFVQTLNVFDLRRIAEDALLAERLDAFVSRFGRLQDTLADKFLPALLERWQKLEAFSKLMGFEAVWDFDLKHADD